MSYAISEQPSEVVLITHLSQMKTQRFRVVTLSSQSWKLNLNPHHSIWELYLNHYTSLPTRGKGQQGNTKNRTLPFPTSYASGAQQRKKIEKPSMLSGLSSVLTFNTINI